MRVQKIRYEHFGGIIGTEDPIRLIWVDREYLRSRGFDGAASWKGEEPCSLRAPVEMEICLTQRCNLACPCCYMEAGPEGGHTPTHIIMDSLRIAAEMEVFHVAFGGGEPLLHPRLLEFAASARRLKLLPTLTTNGLLVTEGWARSARGLFARVNVSLDTPAGPRDDRAGVNVALGAVQKLRRAGLTAGLNVILTAGVFQDLPEIFASAARAGADSLLVLRPKPSGRGRTDYRSAHPDADQQSALLDTLLQLSSQHCLPFHLDCAWAPLLLSCGIGRDTLDIMGAYGCIAGRLLVTVDQQGMVRPCSHLSQVLGPITRLPHLWYERDLWSDLRERSPAEETRCSSCDLQRLCGGGCLAVNEYYSLGAGDPDPDLACPLPHPPVAAADHRCIAALERQLTGFFQVDTLPAYRGTV